MTYLAKNVTPLELSDWMNDSILKPFLIDVREDEELVIASLPFEFLHLPLSESNSWMCKLNELIPTDRRIVVFCHAGVRSLNFANWLIEQNCNLDVWNLKGGIDSWSLEIDQSLRRY